MTCSVTGCSEPAVYRTGGPLIGFVCAKHMELALDGGMAAEELVSLPQRRSA